MMNYATKRRRFSRYIILALTVAGTLLVSTAWVQKQDYIGGLWEDIAQAIAWCILFLPLLVFADWDLDSRGIRRAIAGTFGLLILWRLVDITDEIEALRHVPLIGADSAFQSGLQHAGTIAIGAMMFVIFFLLFDELVKSNTKLQERSAHLTNLIDNIPSACFTFDRQGTILSWNRAAEKVYGYTSDEAVGSKSSELFVTEETKQATDRLVAKIFSGKSVDGVEWHDQRKDGQLGWRTGTAFPLLRADGSVECGVSINVDVTDHRNAKEALRASEERFRRAFEEGPLGMAIMEKGHKIARANRALCKMLGYDSDELAGKSIEQVAHPEDVKRAIEMSRSVAKGEPSPEEFEKRYLTKEGKVVWGRISAAVIHDDTGKPLHGLAMVEDITRRKQAEDRLRASETRFRRLYESNIIGIAFGSIDGRLVDANDAFLRLVDYDRDDLPFRLSDITPEEHRDEDKLAIESLQACGAGTTIEKEFVSKEGRRVPALVGATRMPDSTTECIAFAIDIAEQKEAEEALRRGELRLQLVMDNVPALISYVDREMRYRYVNRGYEEWFGRPRDEMIGTHPWDNIGASAYQRTREHFDAVLAGEPRDFENEIPLGRQSSRWAQVHLIPDRGDDGQVLGFYAMIKDITEQKRAEHAAEDERNLLRKLIDIQERDRRTVAYDLHDGLLQYLVGAQMQLDSCDMKVSNPGASGEKGLDLACDYLRKALREGRRLISGLRPPIIDEAGLVAAIEHLIAEISTDGKTRIAFDHESIEDTLPPLIESTLYRIAQEALANVRRHSGSKDALLQIRRRGSTIRLDVRDWGKGFHRSDVPPTRFGLEGIEERARLFGGKAVIASAPGRGTHIHVEMPLELPISENGGVSAVLPSHVRPVESRSA